MASMHGYGRHAWLGGMHGRGGGVHGRGACVWQGGMCGRGAFVVGPAWQGACVAGGMHGGGGHA